MDTSGPPAALRTRGEPSGQLRDAAGRALEMLAAPPLVVAPGTGTCEVAVSRLVDAVTAIAPQCRVDASYEDEAIATAVTDAIIGAASEAIRNSVRHAAPGLVAFVLAIVMAPVGLVANIAMLIWNKKSSDGYKLAIWGIVVSIVLFIASIVMSLIILSMFIAAAKDGAINMEALCAHRDQWGWLIDSLRYACP